MKHLINIAIISAVLSVVAYVAYAITTGVWR